MDGHSVWISPSVWESSSVYSSGLRCPPPPPPTHTLIEGTIFFLHYSEGLEFKEGGSCVLAWAT